MSAARDSVKIMTVASCSNVRDEHRGHVVVSGSYGGRYNAYNAAKWPVRAVIMNDAGIGKDDAGIVGLGFLDQIGLAAATADATTCHIGDGDHMLEHGVISHVNRTAAELGCAVGQTVRDCAERMRLGQVPVELPPLRKTYPKLLMTEGVARAFVNPPSNPQSCLFSRMSVNYSADLKSRVEPCVFGGNPDCSQCGCSISSALHWVQNERIAGPLRVGHMVSASLGVGTAVNRLRSKRPPNRRQPGARSSGPRTPLVQIQSTD